MRALLRRRVRTVAALLGAGTVLALLLPAAAPARSARGTAAVTLVEGAPCFAPEGVRGRDLRVVGVSVTHAQKAPGSDWRTPATEVWGFRGEPPGLPFDRIAPEGCLRYGRAPADAADPVAAQPLRAGRAYSIEINAAPAGGGRASAWTALFCLADGPDGRPALRTVRGDPTAGPWPEGVCPP